MLPKDSKTRETERRACPRKWEWGDAKREADLVTIREEGKQTFYSLNQENVAICCGKLMIKFAPESITTEKLIQTLKA